MSNLEIINTRIDTIAASEKVTKFELGLVSRELLAFVLSNGDASFDVQPVNRLIGVLTPMNKKTAVLFFAEFLPFALEGVTFGKMQKAKKDVAIDRCLDFLDDELNNIWTWAADNIKLDKKQIDWSKRIEQDVAKAIDEDNGGLSMVDVLKAVLAGGVSSIDLGLALEVMADNAQQDEMDAADAAMESAIEEVEA